MSWDTKLSLDAGARAALGNGKNLLYVCPPAAWAVAPLIDRIPDPAGGQRAMLILCPQATDAVDLAETTDRAIHPVTGLARTIRLLRAGPPSHLAVTPADALELVSRSALKLDRIGVVVMLWPETLTPASVDGLETVLADTPGVQRIAVTGAEADLDDFRERHLWRAPIARLESAEPPLELERVRYAVIDSARRARATRATLDVVDPASTVLWNPGPTTDLAALRRYPDVTVAAEATGMADLALATDLPSCAILVALAGLARETAVLLRPSQVPYLRRMVPRIRVLPLPNEIDRARDEAFLLRSALRERLEQPPSGVAFTALEPLLEEFDPVTIAAAALAGRPTATEVAPPATWTRIHVALGRRDNVGPGDFVGLLVNAVGLRREDVGRIEMRDKFALIDVHPEDADRAVRGLTGQNLKGRRVTARPDRR